MKLVLVYSGVPNKRVGWNKHVGGKIFQKLINVLFLINMLVGNNGMKSMQFEGNFFFESEFIHFIE